MITERIIEVLDARDIFVEETDRECFVEFWSEAGEDFCFYLAATNDSDFVDEFVDYALDFDPDAHAEMYVGMRGERGVPETIRELLDDAHSIKGVLESAAAELKMVLTEV